MFGPRPRRVRTAGDELSWEGNWVPRSRLGRRRDLYGEPTWSGGGWGPTALCPTGVDEDGPGRLGPHGQDVRVPAQLGPEPRLWLHVRAPESHGSGAVRTGSEDLTRGGWWCPE